MREKPKILSDGEPEIQKRLFWRTQFAKRGGELKEHGHQYSFPILYELPLWDDESLSFLKPHERPTFLKTLGLISKVMHGFSSISVLHQDKKGKKESFLEGMDIRSERLLMALRQNHDFTPKSIDAVDKEQNTITVKIKLDRQVNQIHEDIDLLLDLLKREAKEQKIKPWHHKSPQFDIYERMIRVHDLKKENPKMHWSEIAKIVFPDEVYSPSAYKRKPRQEKIATASAINKVMRDAKEAKKMIEGGWRQI